MPLKENQHQNFSYEVLPLLFHGETRQFFFLLKRDGVAFLKVLVGPGRRESG